MDYQDLGRGLRKDIERQLRARGVRKADFDPEEVEVARHGRSVRVTYRDIEIDVPAPSQDTINEWWKDHGTIFATALVVLAGVVVGGILVGKMKG